MRILEPRCWKGIWKFLFTALSRKDFTNIWRACMLVGFGLFFFSSSVCSLFFFSFFVYTVLRDAQLSSTTIGCSHDNLRSRTTDKSKLCFEWKNIYTTFYSSSSSIVPMREKDSVSFEKMSLAKMERINSRNVRATFEFESVSKPRGILQGWDYHVHTYMEQRSVSPWIPLPILIGNFSRPSTRGRREGEGARRDYIGMDCA